MDDPDRISLTILDRGFLIPETDDPCGVHFPMSPITAITLWKPLQESDLVSALHTLVKRVPQLRLGYTLDFKQDSWNRVPDQQLDAYLRSLVERDDSNRSPDEFVSIAVRTNTALPKPIRITVQGKHLFVQFHHSLGDGQFRAHLVSYLLTALYKPDMLGQLAAPRGYQLPVWRIICQNPRRALSTMTRGLSYFVKAQLGIGTPLNLPTLNYHVEPIRSGSPMNVMLKTLPAETITRLNQLRASLSQTVKISLNTLLQVLVAQRLIALNLLVPPVLFSIPVSLYRYMDTGTASGFYPGNLAYRLRAKGYDPNSDFRAICADLQSKIDEQLNSDAPLVNIPSEWIMGFNRSTYKHLNRDWLVDPKVVNKDPRIFNLTNHGDLTAHYEHLSAHVDLAAGIFNVIPLMGRPPLVLSFNSVAGQGNLAVTYNPAILSLEQVESLLQAFSPELLQEI